MRLPVSVRRRAVPCAEYAEAVPCAEYAEAVPCAEYAEAVPCAEYAEAAHAGQTGAARAWAASERCAPLVEAAEHRGEDACADLTAHLCDGA